ncbi:putative transcription factor interactor and regulator CCHC(Zn) family [Helianthus annuus]|nr:putative transcription factor interactor and regulator CCHC(Zn) family [Helianthus annuus]
MAKCGSVYLYRVRFFVELDRLPASKVIYNMAKCGSVYLYRVRFFVELDRLPASKSSINSRPVDKRATPSVNFVSKGTFDPSASSSPADEVKVEGVIGDEQASNSHVPDGLGENVDACVTENESANRANEPAEPSDSKCESPEAADSEKLESVEVSAKVSGISSDKPELSDSAKADDMKDEEKTDVKKAPSTQAEQSEPSINNEKVQIKQQEPKRAGKGREKKKPKHQRQAGSPQSSTGRNNPQKTRDVKNAFVKPVSNGKCEKYAFDYANKAFRKTGEISEQDLQSKQNKKNQKKSPPQKVPANDKYRHLNSSSSAGNVQHKQAQKGPVRPSGPGRANPADQNAFYMKRQICFNCGIAGHIARNCTHRPYVPYYMQNQRVASKDNYHSKPMKVSSPKAMKNVNPKVKPSDGDWNAAKNKRKAVQEQKRVSKINKPETARVAQPKATNTFVKPRQIWKPKSKAATSPILETKGDLCLKEVSYFDASGNPRTTMAWVPTSY